MHQQKKIIVITRPSGEGEVFAQQLQKSALSPFFYPTIKITKNVLTDSEISHLKNLSSYDWILFTSRHGVHHFMDTIKIVGADKLNIQKIKIGAVGPKTAEELQKNGLPVTFIPSRYTTADLAQELPDIQGEKILLPRSAIATAALTDGLKKRGAHVVTIPIYQTVSVGQHQKELLDLLDNNLIICITFTSPSTVAGFVRSLEKIHIKEKIFSIPVLSIGLVTAAAAKQAGFRFVHTADTFTTEGMVEKLKELF